VTGVQTCALPISGKLVSGQVLLYNHSSNGAGPSPQVRFQIYAALPTGEIDQAQVLFSGPLFTIPVSVNKFENAAFFPIGNTSPICLSKGQTYFFAVSERDNTINPAGSITLPGSDAFGNDKFPGHIEVISPTTSIRQSESLDFIFSLAFQD